MAKSNRGFAAMDAERQREIASKGGQMSGGNFKNDREKASRAGKKSGGNFANDREKASAAGRKGGSRQLL
ncbi:MAG TPA: general stress protein [Candidatus Saccharimonadales bacterium]|nr:general stress protein [Candidatus Saccharimonadales bacterium]